jgi:hypothetical protein
MSHHVKQQAQVQLSITSILAQAICAFARKQSHRLGAAAAAAAAAVGAAPACYSAFCC